MVDKPVLERIEQVLTELSRYVARPQAAAQNIAVQKYGIRAEPDHSQGDISPNASRVALARTWIRANNARDKAFGPGLFSDPAWCILLDLYVGHYDGQPVSVTSAAHAAKVPASTGVRWVAMLEKLDLVIRTPDPIDRRRILVSLTGPAIEVMDRLFDGIGQPASSL